MIDLGLRGKVAVVTGAHNPCWIGAAVARAFVVLLASDQACWVSGQTIYVGGGHGT